MNLRDRVRRWWKPAQWQEDHPLSAEERAIRQDAHGRDGFVDRRSEALAAATPDRVDVDRDFRKP
jgi:hypothetical protein